MYGYLADRLSPVLARLLTGVWYGLVAFAIYYCSYEPEAYFRYIEL